MKCEDYPCCGHEPGGCPYINEETGEKRFACARCDVLMPPRARSAVCDKCHKRLAFAEYSDEMPDRYYEDEPSDSDAGWDMCRDE
jgi:hypothetical protein